MGWCKLKLILRRLIAALETNIRLIAALETNIRYAAFSFCFTFQLARLRVGKVAEAGMGGGLRGMKVGGGDGGGGSASEGFPDP